MDRNTLYVETAALLHVLPEYVEGFCMSAEESALDVVTPQDLAAQMLEYAGVGESL
jgi:hypothetical protein